MQILPQDIYINNGTIWLSQDSIIKVCDVSYEYLGKVRCKYKKTIRESWTGRDTLPDTGKAWRWAKISGTYYYAYNNIPDVHPVNFRSLLPKPEELAAIAVSKSKTTDFEEHFKNAVKQDYAQYLHLYNGCTTAQQQNISKYAAVLKAAAEYIIINKINTNKSTFFARLATWCKNNMVPYAPGNPRIMKEKVLGIMDALDITEVARIPRAGNHNAQKEFTDDEILSWVLQMKLTGRNYSDAHIIRKVKDMCKLTLKPEPSERWIGTNITEQHNTRYLTAEKNYGSASRIARQYSGYQRFKNALFAGDCWEVDGTRVNIAPHKAQVVDKKTGEVKEVLNYLWIVVVRDVHSGDILGHTYTYNENRWEVLEVLRQAVKTAGYLPYEIVFDKFPGHNTEEAKAYLAELEHMGVTVTMSSSKTVKESLERWFGTLQDVFLQESKYYYGQGIKSTRAAAHRSQEYMKQLHKESKAEGFDWATACRHTDALIEAYRNTPYKAWSKKHRHIDASPAELHQMSEKPDVRMMEEQDYYFLFGYKHKYKFRGQGLLEITIRDVKYCYRCTDYNVVSQYPEVLVSYDLEDLSHVHIYKLSDNIIKQYLGRVDQEQQAQRYGSKATWGVMATNKAKIVHLKQQQQHELQQKIAVGSDYMVLLNPMSVSKAESEQNESSYLNEQFGIKPPPMDEGNDLDIDITDMY